MNVDSRLNTLAEDRADQFEAVILHNRVYEAVKHQHNHGPDLRRFVTVAEDAYELAADQDNDDRRLDVFGAAEDINDHIDDVADEVVAATLADLLEEIDDWGDTWDDEEIEAAKHEAREWLQAHEAAAKRADVWEEVCA
ncbi:MULTISPECIES: hypothetical protein [Actinomycetes]|uniref:hypothetical protein n=1 Tax=Aeromicrobium tamlense TaxID=375541 RepID=UPI0031DE7129